VMMSIFAVAGIGLGMALLKYPEAIARFFASGASTVYPRKPIKRIYTARNAQWAGGGYIVFGLLALGILIWRLSNGYGFK